MGYKPSWLAKFGTETGLEELLDFGFDDKGMWFSGSRSGSSAFPVRSNFTYENDDIATLVFTYTHTPCADHSVAFFLNSETAPEFEFETNSTRLQFVVDCGEPALYGPTLSDSDGSLTEGQVYTTKLTFNSAEGTLEAITYEGTKDAGVVVSTMQINEGLGGGAFRFGFDADNDAETPPKSYFSNLIVKLNGNYLYQTNFQRMPRSCAGRACALANLKGHGCLVKTSLNSAGCTCTRWKWFTAQCSRIQQALGICSGTSGGWVPAITICNQRLF